MFPEEAYESNSKSIIYNKSRPLNGGIFLSSLLVIGPLLHELGHAVILELKNCQYDLNLGFSHFQGVHGSVEPFCHLNETSLLIFYLSGFLAVITIALIFNLLYNKNQAWSIGSITTGLYISNILALGGHGDVHLAAKAANLPEIFIPVFSLILVIAVSSPSLKIWETMFDTNSER